MSARTRARARATERATWAASDEAATLAYLMDLRRNRDCRSLDRAHVPMCLLTEQASAFSPLPREHCADCGRLLLDV